MEQVQMTAEERQEFEEFRREKQKKEAAEKAKQARETYKVLVDEAISDSMQCLTPLSAEIARIKGEVMARFQEALKLKGEIFDVATDQRSHMFTNSASTARIHLGVYVTDGYRDTVNEGIAKVKEYIEGLAKDDASRALVKAVLRLLSRDQAGNLKASRVLQLRKMAEESGDDCFMEGVKIIEESYQPNISKQYIRAEVKDPATGAWKSVPLGMTEAEFKKEKRND